MSDEHMIAIVSFDGAIKREVKRVREKMKLAAEKLGKNSLRLEIEASGRILDGDLKIKYSISMCEYGTGEVTGGSLNAVLDEVLRREGWTAINAPLQISQSDSNDIPF